jgi:hypothetical protein
MYAFASHVSTEQSKAGRRPQPNWSRDALVAVRGEGAPAPEDARGIVYLDRKASNPFDGTTHWIWSGEGMAGPRPDKGQFRVRHFRRTFEAPARATLTVHVSADTCYRLWCNGVEVAFGPGKSDIEHQFYDTLDLTPHLREGKNVLAATVEYHGDSWAEVPHGGQCSRMSARPGFTLFGVLRDAAGNELAKLHSDRQWRVCVDDALGHQDCGWFTLWLGGMEVMDCARFPWGFQEIGFDDAAWLQAVETALAVSDTWTLYATSPHRLVPRMIAPLEVSPPRRFARAVRSPSGEDLSAWSALLAGKAKVTVPAGRKATVILDAGEETTGYPRLVFAGGKGATMRLRYAEALFVRPQQKGQRNDSAGELQGYFDTVLPDGPSRAYSPFFWRTFRFVAVEVEVAAEPLSIESLDYRFCAYPFEELARFESSDPSHAGIWQISWRTARLCAHETYEDCPYYEQLQYGGDTQVQAMIGYYVPGDASLARQFLYQYDWSRTSDGLTRSRYPARVPQVIPFWSLHWVMAVHDYWRYTGDLDSVKDLLPGTLAVLDYFDRRVTSEGIVGKLSGWQCADWCPQWTDKHDGSGVPPGALAGRSAFVNLITAVTLDRAAEFVAAAGKSAAELRRRSAALKQAVHRLFCDERRGLYRDRPGDDLASAYTNVWAILAGMPCDRSALAERVVNDRDICQLTMFSIFFAYRALALVGRYDLAPALLEPWRRMMAEGLTTCPEIPDFAHTRSDCHAWSAAPPVEFLGEILGVYPAQPGYATIGIAPKPAGLTFARGCVPLTRLDASQPARFVHVAWRIEDGEFRLDAEAPEGVPCRVRLPNGRVRNFPRGGQINVRCR